MFTRSIIRGFIMSLVFVSVIWADDPEKSRFLKDLNQLKKNAGGMAVNLVNLFNSLEKRISQLEKQVAELQKTNSAQVAEIKKLKEAGTAEKLQMLNKKPLKLIKKPPKLIKKPPPLNKKPPKIGGKREIRLGLALQENAKDAGGGLLVVEVDPGFAGSVAGITKGCVLLSFNGKKIQKLNDLFQLLKDVKTGDPFTIVFCREDGKVVRVKIIGSNQKGESKRVLETPGPGTKVHDAGQKKKPVQKKKIETGGPLKATRKVLGLLLAETGTGRIEVKAVLKDSAGNKAGIKPGDIILSVGGKKISKLSEFQSVLNKNKSSSELEFSIERPGNKKKSLTVYFLQKSKNGSMPEKKKPAGSTGSKESKVAEGSKAVKGSKTPNESKDAQKPVKKTNNKGPATRKKAVFGIEVEDNGEMVRVSLVDSAGPSNGKLKKDDVIFEFAGKKIKTISDLKQAIDSVSAGKEVKVRVFRQGKEITVQILPDLK